MRSQDDLVHFLALRLAAGHASAPFCAFLLEPGARWQDAPWAPTPEQLHTAGRQAVALRTLGIVTCMLPDIPARLRDARPHAPCFFVRGDATLLQASAVAVVGSRGACAQAAQWAAEYAYAQAKAGQLVVSGGARGIDAAAHDGALRAGGRTLAYVGSPVDNIYPSANRLLFQRILSRGGAIVSEHPPGAATRPYHHAARNRFIAAHAHTLVVVEAAQKSGTLGTARWAHRLQRAIRVPPEGIARQRAGIDMLLEQGMAEALD